jgi:outer membrane protein insertion porin family
LLINDLKEIEKFYNKNGYLDAQVQDVNIFWYDDSSKVMIFIVMDEGKPAILEDIELTGVKAASDEQILDLLNLKKGETVNFEQIAKGEAKIIEYYGNQGYLSASLTRNLVRDGLNATLLLDVNEGPQYILSDVNVEGNAKTRDWVIKKELKTQQGEILTYKDVELLRTRLYQQGLFQTINIETRPTPFSHIRDLNIKVEEKDAGELSFGGGYGSDEGLRLSGQIGYLNLFGRSAGVGLESRLSFKSRSLNARYNEPFFLKTSLFAESNLTWKYLEEPYFNRETQEMTLKIGKFLSDFWRLQEGYTLRRTMLYDLIPELAEAVGTGNTSLIFTESIFDTRDSKIYTRKGLYLYSRLSIAEPYILGNIGFLRTIGELRAFHPIFKPLIFAFQTKSENIFRLEEADIPLEEIFFLGGKGTVRGYPQNSLGPKTPSGIPTGGKFYYFSRAETRINVWKYLWLKSFIDNGGLYNNISSGKFNASSTGGGFGIRLALGMWTARLEYAWQFSREEIKPGAYYFDLGQEF